MSLIKSILKQLLKETSENFQMWFAGSKAVSNGHPITLFHGTKSQFNVFKPSKVTGNQGETDQIEGIYLTDNRDAAVFFALADNDKFVLPVYACLKNPYYATNNKELLAKLGLTKLAEVNKKLSELNYDSLIVESGFYAQGGPFKLFLVFSPNQVKSVNNDGSFDANDSNIYS